jgi:hypothetical protein
VDGRRDAAAVGEARRTDVTRRCRAPRRTRDDARTRLRQAQIAECELMAWPLGEWCPPDHRPAHCSLAGVTRHAHHYSQGVAACQRGRTCSDAVRRPAPRRTSGPWTPTGSHPACSRPSPAWRSARRVQPAGLLPQRGVDLRCGCRTTGDHPGCGWRHGPRLTTAERAPRAVLTDLIGRPPDAIGNVVFRMSTVGRQPSRDVVPPGG